MKKLYLSLLFILLYAAPASARWASYDDASLEVEFYNRDIIVNEDGTNEHIVETQEKILKEAGRNYAVSYRLNYNSDSSTLIILEAKTINDKGEEFIVTKEMIEDKPVASVGYGFDEQRQTLISYPNVEIGSKIYLKYQTKEFKAPLDKFFARSLYFGINGYWQASRITIDSKLPLHIKVNDPDKVLKVSKDKEDNFHKVTITLTQPIYKELANEPARSILDHKHLTWITVSSLEKWENFAEKLSGDYDKIANQPLPSLFEAIGEEAKVKQNDEDIINIITSRLNEKIQYMGDWRSVKGKFIPRDLEQIATTQVGDCKDFTIATAAILRKLKFKADPALVSRGVGNRPLDSFPNMENFNHVILKVTAPNNKTYWIDPTNIVSMAGKIFPDIASKMALVLNISRPIHEKIPEIDPKSSETIIHNNIEVKNNNTAYISGSVLYKNEEAINMAGAGLYLSKQQIEDRVFQNISGVNLEYSRRKKMNLPDLNSRIVKDLEFSYEYEKTNYPFQTNLGLALPLSSSWVSTIVDVSPDQVSDLFIGPQYTLTKYAYIKNAKANKLEYLSYEVKTPWLNVKRNCFAKNGGIEIQETISVLQNFITREELISSRYKNLRSSLEEKIQGAALILETPSN